MLVNNFVFRIINKYKDGKSKEVVREVSRSA